jgi:LysM repeat protein
MQRTGLLVLLTLLLAVAGLPVGAQDGENLLRDGSFEGSYTGRGSGDLNIPADWNVWVAEPTGQYTNIRPTAYPHRGPDPNPQQGTMAINFDRAWSTYTVAVYQQVSVPEGSNVRGTAYGYLHTCLVPDNEEKCNSSTQFGAYIKVGIDPNGGTSPNDSDIVWSGNAAPHDTWQQISVEATATAGTVTFFIYTSQSTPGSADNDVEAHLNRTYFDNATVTLAGGGGAVAGGSGGSGGQQQAAPPPAAPSTVGRVTAQDERGDGSIVHVVQPGNTIDSIAVAYGVTRQDIMALNNISDPRIIQIGQELLIREGDGSSDDNDEDAGGEEGDNGEEGGEEADPDREYLDPEEADPAPVVSVASGKVLPARDPAATSANVCVMLFDDTNQNRIQEDGEPLLSGGNIVLRNGSSEAGSHTTDGASEPYCFESLASGDYVTVASAPSGYGLTTPNQFRVRANPGSTINVVFGAAQGVVPAMIPPPDASLPVEEPEVVAAEEPENPLLANSGLIVFGLAGLVLVVGTGASLIMGRR